MPTPRIQTLTKQAHFLTTILNPLNKRNTENNQSKIKNDGAKETCSGKKEDHT